MVICATHYQFGRKDAMPGRKIVDGTFVSNGGNNMSIQNGIQHPETIYNFGPSWYDAPPAGYSYYNLWSMDNTVTGFNDNVVVKTVYDPCPVGFKMPASKAFSGFTTTGENTTTKTEFNVNGEFSNGWNFKTGDGSNNTIFFPAAGFRGIDDGRQSIVGYSGFYWTAGVTDTKKGYIFTFNKDLVKPQNKDSRVYGLSVRPVSE